MIGRLLIGIGLLIVVAGITWSAIGFRTTIGEPPDIRKLGTGFEGQLAVPPEEINKALAAANDIASTVNTYAVASQVWATRLLFLVICFGGGVSILAGVQKMPNLPKSRQAALVVASGLLGAGSAISTSGANYLQGVTDKRFACVDEIEKAATKTLRQARAEPDAEAARQYLSDLLRDAARCAV